LVFVDPGRFEIYCHHSPPTIYPEESHETLQVCVPLERALYSVSRQSETGRALVHHLGAQDVLVLPIGQPHGVRWRRSADIGSLQMSHHFITEVVGAEGLCFADTVTLRDPFISAAAAQIRASIGASAPPTLAFAEAMAIVIGYRVATGAALGRRLCAGRDVSAFPRAQLARIESFIEEHLDQPISVAALAGRVNLSVWHFVRRFRASHGLSPHAFIVERRLTRALSLLAQSSLSIAEIALEIGMTHSHFSRSFSNRFGVSPRDYRRLRKN
jgi:AraC family transcriptional regulator